MSVVIKSNTVRIGGAAALQAHLIELRDNDDIPEILSGDISSIIANDDVSELVGNVHGNMHFQISIKEDVSNDFVFELVEDIKRDYKVSDQHHVLIAHKKERADHSDERHFHLVLPYTNSFGKALDTSWNYARNEKLARLTEMRLGAELTKGRFNRSVAHELGLELPEITKGKLHSSRTFGNKAHQKAKRLGIDLAELRHNILKGNNTNEIIQSIRKQSAAEGFEVKRGDRRAVVIIEKNGEAIELNKILDIKRGEQSERFIEQYQQQVDSGDVQSHDERADIGNERIPSEHQRDTGRDIDAARSEQPTERGNRPLHTDDGNTDRLSDSIESHGRTGRRETFVNSVSSTDVVGINNKEQRRNSVLETINKLTNKIVRNRFLTALKRSFSRMPEISNIANYSNYDSGSVDEPLDSRDPYFLQKWSEQQRKNLGLNR